MNEWHLQNEANWTSWLTYIFKKNSTKGKRQVDEERTTIAGDVMCSCGVFFCLSFAVWAIFLNYTYSGCHLKKKWATTPLFMLIGSQFSGRETERKKYRRFVKDENGVYLYFRLHRLISFSLSLFLSLCVSSKRANQWAHNVAVTFFLRWKQVYTFYENEC